MSFQSSYGPTTTALELASSFLTTMSTSLTIAS